LSDTTDLDKHWRRVDVCFSGLACSLLLFNVAGEIGACYSPLRDTDRRAP